MFSSGNEGPEIAKGIIKFHYNYDPEEPDNHVYNEEDRFRFWCLKRTVLSQIMVVQNMIQYFINQHRISPVNTYTLMDEQCADLMLNRSRIHYWNEDYDEDDPEGYDWEIRPDLVSNYYPEGGKSDKSKWRFHVQYEKDGEKVTETYNYFDTPSDVMKMFPEIFSEERNQAKRKERN
ncbi:MAG: hypothetical protein U5Q03_02605 [Bacteroidota bacterium]|nr:hypothetical protein [Bacteroidota bacterium]